MAFTWFAGVYYFGITGKVTLFIVPFVFTCVSALLLLIIRYRYTLFERYPYLMNLPSLFYRIGGQKDTGRQSSVFRMIFTVHALVVAVIGFLGLILTISIGTSIDRGAAAYPFLYVYLATVAVLIVSVLLLYRRIYIRFAK